MIFFYNVVVKESRLIDRVMCGTIAMHYTSSNLFDRLDSFADV